MERGKRALFRRGGGRKKNVKRRKTSIAGRREKKSACNDGDGKKRTRLPKSRRGGKSPSNLFLRRERERSEKWKKQLFTE